MTLSWHFCANCWHDYRYPTLLTTLSEWLTLTNSLHLNETILRFTLYFLSYQTLTPHTFSNYSKQGIYVSMPLRHIYVNVLWLTNLCVLAICERMCRQTNKHDIWEWLFISLSGMEHWSLCIGNSPISWATVFS